METEIGDLMDTHGTRDAARRPVDHAVPAVDGSGAGSTDHGRAPTEEPTALDRTLSLPMLIFYGVGVTVGAGIFALVGEIVDIAGVRAPLAFLVSGAIAGLTGLCYAQLIARYPRAGGEAVYVTNGLGRSAGRVAGLGVVVTGTISSAVISLAFAGYLRDIVAAPEALFAVLIIVALAAVAARGVRESVALAAAITVLEVGTLVVVAAVGVPTLADAGDELMTNLAVWRDGPSFSAVFAGAVVAFFAFVGFEDLANMAEETVDARRNGPRSIVITLIITLVVYVVLALVAVAAPNRDELVESSAPMATLFETLTGRDGRVISAIAVVAMVNGVLVQIVMASRVLYGMANEGLVPPAFGVVNERRRTPMRATFSVAAAIIVLAVAFPLVGLARATSVVTLGVFALVDASLVVIALRTRRTDPDLLKWAWVGAVGAVAAVALAGRELMELVR